MPQESLASGASVTASIQNVLETMLILPTPADQKEQFEMQLAQATEQLEALRLINPTHFYPFENIAEKKELVRAGLKKEIRRLKLELSPYPKIDLDFLSWTKPTSPLPAFMIASLEGKFSLSVIPDTHSDRVGSRFNPVLPEEIESHFKGAVEAMRTTSLKYFDGEEISIWGEIDAVMPKLARTATQEAELSEMFDQIFLVAEAPIWEVDRTKTVQIDPLVIGWNDDLKQARLITVFNPTPLEEYILANYLS